MHPIQVDEEGSIVSHELSYPRIRIRRFSEEVDHNEEVHFKVSAFGNDLHLHLKRNRRLLAPAFKVEVLGKHGRVLKRHTMENCHYVGRVKARSRSTVAMSNCHGLVSARSNYHFSSMHFFPLEVTVRSVCTIKDTARLSIWSIKEENNDLVFVPRSIS